MPVTLSGLRPPLLVASILLAGASAHAQTPPSTPQAQEPTQLEDVTVAATPLQRTSRAFVESVSAPAPGRKAAAWRDPICVGVSGIRPEAAQAMADRVLDWGHSLGLRTGDPGCAPNIFVVMTDNGDATSRALVRARPREFRIRASGVDAGSAALETFQNSGARIRWWHISLPVNSDTGMPIIRLPGQFPFSVQRIESPADLGAYGNPVEPSRINERSRDDLMQVIIIVEMAAFDEANFNQVSDYVSMAALAQIDPETSPPTPSILHLFDTTRAQEPSLTRWDRAYLESLYAVSTVVAGGTSGRVAEGMASRLEAEPAPEPETAPTP
jgi:hypothetical protein